MPPDPEGQGPQEEKAGEEGTEGMGGEKAEGVVDGVRRLRDLQAAEQEAHRGVWPKQGQQHRRIGEDIGEIRSKVEAIVESEVPSVVLKPLKKRKAMELAREVTP